MAESITTKTENEFSDSFEQVTESGNKKQLYDEEFPPNIAEDRALKIDDAETSQDLNFKELVVSPLLSYSAVCQKGKDTNYEPTPTKECSTSTEEVTPTTVVEPNNSQWKEVGKVNRRSNSKNKNKNKANRDNGGFNVQESFSKITNPSSRTLEVDVETVAKNVQQEKLIIPVQSY